MAEPAPTAPTAIQARESSIANGDWRIQSRHAKNKAAGASMPLSQELTGLAKPRRPVCAPRQGRSHSIADRLRSGVAVMILPSLLRVFTGRNRRAPIRKRLPWRPRLEILDDRAVPAVVPSCSIQLVPLTDGSGTFELRVTGTFEA